jgi:hypothetical protein
LYSAQTDYVDDNWCTFKEFFEDVDIHKDNPTLLYYAENGRKDL